MDFGKLDVSVKANEGEWMTVYDLDGDPTDARIKLAGQDSKIYKRRMKQIGEKERRSKKGLKLTEMEREMLETYAQCSVDFENCFIGKKEIKAENFDDVIEFYDNFRFVLDQVMEFIGDRANFLSS